MGSADRYLGLDIGGTSIKVCLLDERKEMVARYAVPMRDLAADDACARLAAQLSAYVRQQRSRADDVIAVGVTVPGAVKGVDISLMPNASMDLPVLLEHLRDVFPNAGFSCMNDANAAAYGEAHCGFGTHAESSLFVCLGTGIGAGYVVDGTIVSGSHGSTGEIGHLKVVKGGRRCGCGSSGCLEQYASAKGIVRTFREADANNPALYADLGDEGSGEVAGLRPRHAADSLSVMRAYAKRDPRACRAVETLCKTLGFALAQVACVLDPEVILLGGGVADSFELFRGQLLSAYRANCIGPCADTPIYHAQLGAEAGAVGAALWSMEHAQ